MNTNFIAYNPYSMISFGTCGRSYNGVEGQEDLVLTDTKLFRKDLEWGDLVGYMEENFKGKDKVNTYCIACSDGSEPYTFAIAVMDKLPKKDHSKYLPIIASDIDEEVVDAAKSGRINLREDDLKALREKTSGERSYFSRDIGLVNIKNNRGNDPSIYHAYKPIPELAQNVRFEQADMLEKLENMKDDGNSVVLCRNVFMYLQNGYIDKVVQAAGNNMKEGSLFVIGNCERYKGIRRKLEKAGFEETMENVFRKKADNQ